MRWEEDDETAEWPKSVIGLWCRKTHDDLEYHVAQILSGHEYFYACFYQLNTTMKT